MCTPWKTKRFGSSGNATMPLQRRMFGPSTWVRFEIHGMNFSRSTSPSMADGDGLHVLVVVMVMSLLEEVRLDLHDAVEIEGLAVKHLVDRDRAILRPVELGIGVDGADAALDLVEFLGRHKVDLVEDDHVGERDLALRLGSVLQPLGQPLGIRYRHHRIEARASDTS